MISEQPTKLPQVLLFLIQVPTLHTQMVAGEMFSSVFLVDCLVLYFQPAE